MGRIKIFTVAAVILLLTVFASVCGASAATVNTDAKDYVIKAYEKLNKLESYHIILETTGLMKFQGQTMNIVMNGESDYQVKPVLLKSVMTMSMTADAQKNEQIIEQYMEQAGSQLIIYTKMDGKWMKQVMPYYDPLGEYTNYFKAIKNVKQLQDTSEDNVFEVVMSGECLQENVKRILASTGMNKMNLPVEIFNNIGDFTFIIAVNKESATVSKVTIDMSSFLAQLGNNLAGLKDVPNDQREMVKAMFSSMKMTTKATFSKPNNIEKIVIPQEAKEAKEIELPSL